MICREDRQMEWRIILYQVLTTMGFMHSADTFLLGAFYALALVYLNAGYYTVYIAKCQENISIIYCRYKHDDD